MTRGDVIAAVMVRNEPNNKSHWDFVELTVRCDAIDESGLERLRRIVAQHLRASGIEPPAPRVWVDVKGEARPGAAKAR